MTPEDSRRRIASTRAPHFYEAGQDVTGIDDPLASYGRFIDRVVTEYREPVGRLSVRPRRCRRRGLSPAHAGPRARRKGGEASLDHVQRGSRRGMADQGEYPGRLIAVDGSRGKDVAVAAGDIVAALKRDRIECAVSRWDASGLFTDLAAGGRVDRNVSIRTLVARLRRRPRVPFAVGDPAGARSRRGRRGGAVHRHRRRASARSAVSTRNGCAY